MTNLLKDLEAVALLYSIVDYENPQKDDLGRFSEALHSLYRTHHGEIAEAVRDKARLDWVEANAHALDWDPRGRMKRVTRADDGAEFCGDTWREQIDAAIDAQHNSAREGSDGH